MSYSTATITCPCQSKAITVYKGVVSTCACGRSYTAAVCHGCGSLVEFGCKEPCPVLKAAIESAAKGRVS